MLTSVFRLIIATLFVTATFSPAQADIIIRLKDGHSITLPIAPDEISSIDFSQENGGTRNKASSHSTAPQLPPAPETNLPAAPKPLSGATTRGDKRVLSVGPSHDLKKPSDAAQAAKNGDIIEIEPGDYRGDVAIWTKNNLTIRGVGGRPHIDAAGNNADGKAIWVITGSNTTVENIELSGARVGDNNGAGIRQEGANLTLDHCYFHDNQIGILAGQNAQSDIVIRNSEFARNRLNTKQNQNPGHNIYIGAIHSFTLENSYIHDAEIGHNVKSRAAHNIILKNRIEDGDTGSSSYLLDLPSGGVALIQGNHFQKGSKAESIISISYGAELMLYQENSLTITGNNFINEHLVGIFINNHSQVEAKISGNQFKGLGIILRGNGAVSDN